MSYANAIPQIQTRLQAVDGLLHVEAGEPKQVNAAPMAYYLFARGTPIGQMSGITYTVMIRVLVAWLDNANSELDIAPFVHSIPATFSPREKDAGGYPFAKLGGTVDAATITSLDSGEQGGFHTVNNVPYRSITYELTIKENNP